MVLVSAAGVLGLRALVARYERSVAQERLLDEAARQRRTAVSGPLNYLIIGSDLRANDPEGGQRADTIVIAHVPAGLGQAYLVSIPRDLRVEIPGYGTDKINAAFAYGRAPLLSAAVTGLTGVNFDGAAIIDFSGFQHVVDLLGGVTMCVDTPTRSIHTGRVFTAGCHQMSGAIALDYARQRYDLPAGDFDRQRHHQQLLKAILAKASGSGLATNPLKLDQLIRAVGSSLTVDTNGVPLQDLIFAMRGLRAGDLVGLQVPAHAETIGGTSYALLDDPAPDLFAAVSNAEVAAWATANPKWINKL
ncbi:LCP family protein [Phytohabitans sp. ZYX-F-186]|uniref:LCP family protein n=1 Tax=Phytohabitans maris TaxID=3071409 RepID=A0ABU0ZVI9_9ACTN|nr:LCP family protein [Phytohabitans sp. ZYX-F-186]MDQ7911056.1 LCP family protein [Phytohabitans sp. ZYX-F-186]